MTLSTTDYREKIQERRRKGRRWGKLWGMLQGIRQEESKALDAIYASDMGDRVMRGNPDK
jgi:hypothetical protein